METVNTEITIEEKSEYLSVVNWVIEHYPYDSVFTMSDISTHMSDLDEDDEEELEKIFDEYLEENHTLSEGGKYLFYTHEEYERIFNSKERLKEELEEVDHTSFHLDI